MKKTLVILAAGMGSRFGGGIKQLEPVGPNGEIIIDYSIHDAIKAGFNKIIFIIRKDLEDDFKEVIGNRIESICSKINVEVCYAFQNMDNIPEKIKEGRTKPFGTAHAILCCEGLIDSPFAVINADDYYGINSFKKASQVLETGKYGIIAYILKNTLSESGSVSRGICEVENGLLKKVVETLKIVKTDDGAEAEGIKLNPESYCSMNFWCLPVEFVDEIKEGFENFLNNITNTLKEEYYLPTAVSEQIAKGKECIVMKTEDKWFGVTYKEDKPSVVAGFKELYEQGLYNTDLYSDLK